MSRIAVFVDAGYFWVQLCKTLTGNYTSRSNVTLDYEKLREMVLAEVQKQFGAGTKLLRVYWYDGPGLSGKTAEHAAIDQLDDFKLRLGTRNTVGTQKGVDGLIIADLISLTQQKSISDALLMTGDGDITPGVVAAQGMGLRVHLLSLGASASTSPYLAAEVDFKGKWANAEASQFAKVSVSVTSPVAVTTASGSAATAASTPVAVPATVSAPAATPAEIASIVSTAIVNMKAGPHSPDLVAFTAIKALPLPKELDLYLISAGSAQMGRRLTPAEARAARAEFIKSL